MNKETPRPILRWPGGKTRLLKKILPRISPHLCYCEPFAGGLAVLFAKERSPIEVVNDINGDLISFYLNVQRHLPEVLRFVEQLVCSRELLYKFTRQPALTEIERAAQYLLRNRISHAGNMSSFGVVKTDGGGVGFDRRRHRRLLQAAHERLNKVVIEQTDYERCLKNYDSPETFFYCDPPYLNHKMDAYAPWNEAEMRGFRRNLEKLKGRWIVTLDDSDFNRQLFSDCQVEAVKTQNGSVNTRTHGSRKFGELIITPFGQGV